MAWYNWSRTTGSNATADSTINFAEGQAPSSLNDSCRAVMARAAEYRDDIAGAIATTGTSTAYAVTSYQVFDTLAHMSGQMIAFTPHTTNAATVTLNVDSLGAKALRSSPNVELQAGTLIQGTPYLALYNNSDAAWYLQGFYGNAYNIPLAGCLEFWGTTAPNSSFVFPYGQAISRTTYSALFALISTTFGAGDSSTTFNLPDCRGRFIASPDNMGGSDISRLAGSASIASVRNTLGGGGGAPTVTLDSTMIPAHNHSATDSGHTHVQNAATLYSANGAGVGGSTGTFVNPVPGTTTASGTANITVGNTGGGLAHDNVPPVILANRIMRVI